jgi:hypothetical protein
VYVYCIYHNHLLSTYKCSSSQLLCYSINSSSRKMHFGFCDCESNRESPKESLCIAMHTQVS